MFLLSFPAFPLSFRAQPFFLVFPVQYDLRILTLCTGRVNIPFHRNWRSPERPCPFLLNPPRPLNELIDVESAIDAAEENVTSLKDEVDRVFPTVISRLYRGGKTTLIDLIARRLATAG